MRKLLWYHQGGEVATHQWRDLVQVMRANPALDLAYIEHWSRALDLEDLLARAREEAHLR